MKKKRREGEAAANGQDSYNTSLSDLDAQNHNHKRKKKKKKTNKFIPTVSIALPGSIIDNVQTPELKTRLAGQIARAATIFRIDEVIIFDNKGASVDDSVVTELEDANGNESGASFLVRILQYLETPQYLRRSLFPKHNSLRFVGLLPPLDAPHHLRKHEWAPYREGITLNEEPPNLVGTLVDVGLNKYVVVDQKLEPGIRVTVAMGTNRDLSADCFRKVVLSSEPREEMGLYWGYKVRYAPSISYVFKHCPYEGGYDHLIGTSEHGLVVTSSELTIPAFRHLLIAFGGLAGLEENIEEDANFKVKDVRDVFNAYLNTCPNQGSRTIRTEEAIFISLQFFQEPVKRAMQRFEER
ncbi:putative RNA methyltransferase [Cinnamomum micranthum f. kanehirae]|uniref:Putative RNA methyltransferase n=1 Tax=Cinnamomum micranthum f. kanehirae TaxID=337451 RepID=A0A443PSK6_9MAGN|nr:putative RNA methyltransferase [Cinnamomum micranthum f. kanehirae]